MPRASPEVRMLEVRQLLADKGHRIFAIAPDENVLAAVRLMADHYIGALLVMRGEELVGLGRGRLGRALGVVGGPRVCAVGREVLDITDTDTIARVLLEVRNQAGRRVLRTSAIYRERALSRR